MQLTRFENRLSRAHAGHGVRRKGRQVHGVVSRTTLTSQHIIRAGKNETIDGIVTAGTKLVENASQLVPSSIPRPVAKAGVAIAGGVFIFGLVQQVLSGFITLIVLGGLGYFFFTRSSSDTDDEDSNKGEGKGEDDLSDPLSEAQRIMKKYGKQ